MANLDNNALFQVSGLVAVVTGGGSGLGRMMARALASNGAAKVYVIGRRLNKLEETAEGFSNITPIQGDATDKDSLKAAAERVKAESGYVNLVIANSGVSGPGVELPQNPSLAQIQDHFWSYNPQDLNNVWAVNNTGAFFTMVAFLELLDAGNKSQKTPGVQSQVIIIASIAGYSRSLATTVAYVPSKAASIQQVKLFSTFFAKHGIRVNGIAPGIYPSEMTEGITDRPGFNVGTIPAGRLGTEEDLRGTVLYLASRAGAYTNGAVLITDGGRLSQLPASY
ncbi:hypothetical protein PRZ48_014228 [Zasmidium cellare]|uniref:Uncharacterized protein n=1 Tax=Zasmidium cellare TaxID=395010 RepID=A0ABR0E0C6_ZASCE|nr:hypothetical protein PRZ48_014228 [Zasmidium cellare]